MALYLISYDIDEKDEFEYEFLWKRLKEIGAVRILNSEWALIEKIAKAQAIYYQIAPLVQEKDTLLVQEVTQDAVWDKLLISDAAFDGLLSSARS